MAVLLTYFKDRLDDKLKQKYYSAVFQYQSNVRDQCNIIAFNDENIPYWYSFLLESKFNATADMFMGVDMKSFLFGDFFTNVILPELLNRDKSNDPYGLSPLHIAYLLRNSRYVNVIKKVEEFETSPS